MTACGRTPPPPASPTTAAPSTPAAPPPPAYADALSVYLGFALDRLAMTGNSLVRWNPAGQKSQHCFGRQALPMIWDYSEPNLLATATGSIDAAVFYSCDPLHWIEPPVAGFTAQCNAVSQSHSKNKIVSTDPPYYDNVGYADLSDFFYVWLRRTVRKIFPNLFATLAVPKTEELVATPYRHGGRDEAEAFFLEGMTRAVQCIANQAHFALPVGIYYAFKQAERKVDSDSANTGWETFLAAVMSAGLTICGTWPMHTEMRTRQIAMARNALASSIVLVCRKRPADAAIATRRDLIAALKAELPSALTHLQRGNIAPVDLAQAAIGPGMAVYTRYAKVLDAAGNRVSVGEALAPDQSDARRDPRRAGGGLRCRQPVGAGVVRAVRLRDGRLRRCGDTVEGQEHQRGRHGGRRYPPLPLRQGAASCGRRSCRTTGTRRPMIGLPPGRPSTT